MLKNDANLSTNVSRPDKIFLYPKGMSLNFNTNIKRI